MKKPKINLKPLVKFLGPIVRETLQTVPVIGTIVTNFKQNKLESPVGTIQLTKWDVYRLLLGFGIAYLIAKGILTEEQIAFVWSLIGY